MAKAGRGAAPTRGSKTRRKRSHWVDDVNATLRAEQRLRGIFQRARRGGLIPKSAELRYSVRRADNPRRPYEAVLVNARGTPWADVETVGFDPRQKRKPHNKPDAQVAAEAEAGGGGEATLHKCGKCSTGTLVEHGDHQDCNNPDCQASTHPSGKCSDEVQATAAGDGAGTGGNGEAEAEAEAEATGTADEHGEHPGAEATRSHPGSAEAGTSGSA